MTIHQNPNGTLRKEGKRQAWVLDGAVIRSYSRSIHTNELSNPSTKTFQSEKQALLAFNKIR